MAKLQNRPSQNSLTHALLHTEFDKRFNILKNYRARLSINSTNLNDHIYIPKTHSRHLRSLSDGLPPFQKRLGVRTFYEKIFSAVPLRLGLVFDFGSVLALSVLGNHVFNVS